MNIWRVVLLFACTLASGLVHAGDIKFCVRPGESLERMWSQCAAVRPITEYTEEGGATSYVVSAGAYTATMVPYGGIVDVVRFSQHPLPVAGVRIGDRFSKIRQNHREMELVFHWEEGGHLALRDSVGGMFIVFDLNGIPDDWNPENGGESALAMARVVAVYWGERK